MKLIVGTRGSRLSLVQTDIVKQKLIEIFPYLEIETKIIKTTGDRIACKPLLQIKEKGIFEKEIDMAILHGEVDFAVHSMKDMPTEQPPKIIIAAVPRRESPYDVLVSRENQKLESLPRGAIIGTGSPRREAQLHHVRPDLKVKSIRGNVDTRVKKLEQGLFDAIILAEVGLRRLDMQNSITERLSYKKFTPAPGQGALAVVVREDNRQAIDLLRHINHTPSMAEALAERAYIREIGGGCKVPLGALARSQNNNALSLRASVLSPDGKVKLEDFQVGEINLPEELGLRVAQKMRQAGAEELIQHWRRLYEEG